MNTPENFKGGKITDFVDIWKSIFSDPWLIRQIQGIRVNLISDVVPFERKQLNFSKEEKIIVQEEVEKLLGKQVIKVVNDMHGQIVSNVFLRGKKDGSWRMILNLKDFNKHVENIHFKMETLANAINLMKKNCFFGSIDLKDAYYSVNIQGEHRKYFRFRFDDTLYEFCGLPQGFKDSPRLFTKILKPVLGLLREKGHQLVGYIDDFLVQGDKKDDCAYSLHESGNMFDRLGFTIHPVKSAFSPSQRIEFLGFVLDSVLMEVSISRDKAEKIRTLIKEFLKKKHIVIRDFARVIGSLVALDFGVWIGPVFWRRLELDKARWLKFHSFDFDQYMFLSDRNVEDLNWWLLNLDKFPVKVEEKPASITLVTDASEYGWGAVRNNEETGGCWGTDDVAHINVLELKAVLFGLKALCGSVRNETIKVYSDNSTTVSCVNRKGSAKEDCNEIARNIWLWCLEMDNKVIAMHIPGVENTRADFQSRKRRIVEWKLNSDIFKMLNEMWGPFDIDLFASRLTKQVDVYMSWHPDPGAVAVNALHNEWLYGNMYCFPPYNLIPLIIRKVRAEEVTITLIAPYWTKQVWYPTLMKMLVKVPVLLPHEDTIVNPVNPSKKVDIKLRLMACVISGKSSKVQEFKETVGKSYVPPGEITLERLTLRT